jgi:hypothetical protein
MTSSVWHSTLTRRYAQRKKCGAIAPLMWNHAGRVEFNTETGWLSAVQFG